MELKHLKINFLGDSITDGYGRCGTKEPFVKQLNDRYGAQARSYGIGGTRIARQHNDEGVPMKSDRNFISRVETMEADADVVAVFGGTNDFGHGNAPFGDFADRTPDTFCGALHVLYTMLLEKYPASTIFIMTPLHRADEDKPNMHGLVLKDYVDMIRQTAEYYSLPVLDLYATSGIQPAVPVIRARYLNDGLHPNDTGHALLADKIAAFIRLL